MSTAAPAIAPHTEPICTGNVPLPTPEQLPDDLDTLKRMLIEVMSTLRQERLDKDRLQHRLSLLLQRVYGPRTERINPDQRLLFADWAAAADDADATKNAAATPAATPAAKSEAGSRPRRRCKPHGRGKPPENLPRRPLHHELTEAERLCRCGQIRIEIGTTVSEQVEWQPASLFIWQHIVHKYLCSCCCRQPVDAAMTPSDPLDPLPENKTTSRGRPGCTPTTPRSRTRATSRARRRCRDCGFTWATARIPTTSSTSRSTASATDHKSSSPTSTAICTPMLSAVTTRFICPNVAA
jgi:hypothetical protein